MARNREVQRALYGEPLGDRLRRVLRRLGVSQARLAGGLGVSPAMLSQLISGRRAKIGSPDVYERLVLLERRAEALVPTATDRPADELIVTVLLADVRASRTAHHARPPVPQPRREHDAALAALRGVAAVDELRRAADTLDPTSPSLAAFLRRAAGAH